MESRQIKKLLLERDGSVYRQKFVVKNRLITETNKKQFLYWTFIGLTFFATNYIQYRICGYFLSEKGPVFFSGGRQFLKDNTYRYTTQLQYTAKKCQLYCYSSQALDFCQDILYYLGSVKQTFQCIEGNRVLGSESWSSKLLGRCLFCRYSCTLKRFSFLLVPRSDQSTCIALLYLQSLPYPPLLSIKAKYRQDYLEAQSFRSCREKKQLACTYYRILYSRISPQKERRKRNLQKAEKRTANNFFFLLFVSTDSFSTDSLQ